MGLEFEDKVYFALPVGADYNNEIWVHDLSRQGLWILRWTVSAKYMWLYEDSTGSTHHCVLTSDNLILEFSRTVATADDGVAFRTSVKSGGIVFDPGGISMASIETVRFKFLYPRGDLSISISGIGEDGPTSNIAASSYSVAVPRTGWGQLEYAYASNPAQWSADVGTSDFIAVDAVAVVPVEVDEILNQETWTITTDRADSDYFLSSVTTTGKTISGLYYGD